jgi:hypothetical protein
MIEPSRMIAAPHGNGPDGALAIGDGSAESSLALGNLRALVILIVLAFHSVLAYLGSLGPTAFAFDLAPYKWRAFPIVDSHRWFGFDLFCAWQDVYLMALMFFLSALFTWPSLARKPRLKFLTGRFLRLGVPFVFALMIVMPVALYPTYHVGAIAPGLIAYVQHYLALPFWPNGPMWFLWQLLAFTAVATLLHRFAPHWVEGLGRWSAAARPGRCFILLVTASVLVYAPLALAFTPWDWSNHGPFAFQLSRPLFYAVYYFAGLAVGSCGLGRGLLAPEGILARRWVVWFGGALASFLLWLGLSALTMRDAGPAPFGLQAVVAISFALACASGCFFMIAACMRFGVFRSRISDGLSKNAFGMYVLHYGFVVWLQYALLGAALFAIAKAMIVFSFTLLLAWLAVTAMRFVPFGARLIGEEPRVFAKAPPREDLVPEYQYKNGPREAAGQALTYRGGNSARANM